MAESIWKQLLKILPEVLPADPEQAVNGTELIELVRPRIDGECTDNTLRQHFSVFSKDLSTPIAKVAGRHGYYLRPREEVEEEGAEEGKAEGPDANGAVAVEPIEQDVVALAATRNTQPEEKFRAFFMRYQEQENRFPMHVEHTAARKSKAGMDKWKFPDVIVVQWEAGKATDEGYQLDPEVLRVRATLGDQPLRLTSVELKVDVSMSWLREVFFQCVSNSSWAHSSVLAIAAPVNDASLQAELRRLGTSYDVTVVSFTLDRATLDNFPPADEILQMEPDAFEALAEKAKVVIITTGRQRDTLDWEHLADMRNDKSPDFVTLFQWIDYCLREGAAFSFKDFLRFREMEQEKAMLSGRAERR